MGSPLVARLVVADAELCVLAPIRTGASAPEPPSRSARTETAAVSGEADMLHTSHKG